MRDFQKPGRSTVYAANGMCATSHPLAAAIALDMLKAGGNAVDAALAGAVLLGQCEPQMTGLGGDCFALIHPGPGQEIVALNASGRAPEGISAEALRAAGHAVVPVYGPEAVTVPGAVDGFCALSERFGRLGLDAVLAPAIRYAEEGIPVAPRTAFDWAVYADTLRGAAAAHYLFDGRAPRPGQVFRAPGQAEVLRRIARDGRHGFYAGEVMEDLLAALPEDAPHAAGDFAACRCDWSAPISGSYRGLEVVEHPPNGQGAAVLLLLDMLSGLDLAAMDPFGAQRVHLEAEATKLAYDARNRLMADAGAMPDPRVLQRPGLAADLAALIDPRRAMAAAAPLTEAVHRETVYITVIDRDRMAVSLIYSIFHDFGSRMASPKFGILLHNRGASFRLDPGHPNELAPGKRPMHTILPGMLRENGAVCGTFGVMGGQYQATGHARFVSNLVDYGMELQDALDAPRSFAVDGVLQLERGYDPRVGAALEAIGHAVVTPEIPIGGAQAIRIDAEAGVLIGASDPRKDGIALGY